MQHHVSFPYDGISLYLTGQVRRRYPVVLTWHGHEFEIALTGRAFAVTGDLSVARLERPTSGRSILPSIDEASRTTAIYDLRTTIDDALEVDGIGHQLIQNTFWGEYSLMIPATAIQVGPAFRDRAPRHLAASTVTRILAAVSARCPVDFVSAP